MTLEQTFAFVVIALMMAAFIWGRFRYDLVACCSLLLALALGIVPFVDAGTVGSDATPGFDEIKVGAGIGARYYTSFGPLRLDVGIPLNPGPGDSSFAVYVALGQTF